MHLGVVKGWGSSDAASAGAVVLASEDIRIPLPCVVGIGCRMQRSLVRPDLVFVLAEREPGPPLYAQFEGNLNPDHPAVRDTVAIARFLFGESTDVLATPTGEFYGSPPTIWLGRQGLVMSGPILRIRRDGSLTVEEFIKAAEELARKGRRVSELGVVIEEGKKC